MVVKVIDTTLRDGEQRAGIAFNLEDKLEIAKLLTRMGIDQIEVGTPSMGGREKKSIKRIVEQNLKSKISTWNRMKISDIEHSIDCGVDIVHISVPSSDVQIISKLKKDREWVMNQMKKCIYYAKDKGFAVSIGFEDASRADFNFLISLGRAAGIEEVDMIRYADTVGILHPQRILKEMAILHKEIDTYWGIHTHNDFGMAIANSLAAVKGGARYVDCTIGGIGERAGNCNYIQFIEALNGKKIGKLEFLKQAEKEINRIIKIGYKKKFC